MATAGLVRFRNFTDKLADVFSEHTVDLLRVSAGMRRWILRDLTRLEADLVRDLMNATGRSALSNARLRALLRQTRATIDTAYGRIADKSGPELEKITAAVARRTIKAVNTVARVDLMTTGLSQEQVVAIAGKSVVNGRYPAEWWKKQSPALRDRFAEQMRQGQYRGEGIDELTRRIRGTRALNYKDGIMAIPKRQAETLARTSVITVANEAKLASFLKNRDVIRAIEWVATLDARVTEICRHLNGKVWLLPKAGDKDGAYIPDGHDTPFPGATSHWGCRSTQVPVTYSFAELAAIGGELEN